MDEEDACRKLLSDCEKKILTELVPNEVLEDPLMKTIIGEDVNLKYIKEHSTSTIKNQLIFQHIHGGGDPAYQRFKQILKNTKHLKLLAYLHQKEIGVPDDQADLWPLIVDETLRRCWEMIIEVLEPCGPLNRLLEEGVVNPIQYRDISEQQTTTEKNKHIYDEVDKQGITGYSKFKQVLQDTKQTGVLESLSQEERKISNELVTSKHILEDYIHYRKQNAGIESELSHRHTSNSQMPLTQMVRELGTEFEERYKSQLMQQLDPGWTKKHFTQTNYMSVLLEMFRDGIHWGRIVGLVSFCGALSVSSLRHEGFAHDTVLDWTLEYITRNLDRWIKDNGGWTALLDFLESSDDQDDTDGIVYRDAHPLQDRTTVFGNGDGTQNQSQMKAYVKQFLWVAGAFALGVAVSRK